MKYYTQQGRLNQFPLRDFNREKKLFDYGSKGKGDLSTDILASHIEEKKLHINGKEMWTLIENLPLILMKLVQNLECEVFQFSVLMVKLLFQVTRRSYSEAEILEMSETIRQHHRLYLTIFNREGNETHLTFKFHVMLHYELYIERFGPVRNAMTFKFEMKHQVLKSYALQCYTRKNLPFSLCKKLCFKNAYTISNQENIFQEIKEISYKKISRFASTLPGLKFCSKLNYRGIDFEIGDIVKAENIFIIRGIGIC